MKTVPEALIYTIIMILGNLAPILFGLLGHLYYDLDLHLAPFISSGEFYLYSVSFFVSGAFVFYTKKIRTSDVNSILFIFATIGILIASFLYALSMPKDEIVYENVKLFSLGIFAVSLVLFVISSLVQVDATDPRETEKAAVDDIMDKLSN